MDVIFRDMIPSISGLLGLLKVLQTLQAKHPIYLELVRCLEIFKLNACETYNS